ncbi:MAG: tryptophan--tRNA ligase [Candidatus Micrarchaeia archaeon]
MDNFVMTPYKVEGKIDYDVLIKNFGITPIDEALEARLKKYTGELHFFLRRKIFFAHREMNWLLDQYEDGNPFYIYTGIAPSAGMTVANLIPFMMAQWLQSKFDVEVYIQIPDEEKFFSRNIDLETTNRLAHEAALDIMALGFKKQKTKIFIDTEYAGVLYKQAARVAKRITVSEVKDAFGIDNSANIGWTFYTSMQAVPAFLKSVEEGKNVPCLIPLGVDQDVHFRLARDVIEKMGYYKPAILHSKFMPGLNGSPKMSGSDPNNTIYLSDTPEIVEKKVNKAITGQQPTAELQKKYGGDPEKCAVCQYNKYMFEPDDKKLEEIFEAERNGTLLAGEHKKDLIKKINAFLATINRRKAYLQDRMDDFLVTD